MLLTLHVKPKSGIDKITPISEGVYKVFVKAPPCGGQANAKVLELLAKYLNIPKSRLQIKMGKTASEKLIAVLPEL